jgi:hypothetical protein
MSDIKIKLSKSGIDNALFHDYEYEYPESNRGANGDTLTLTIENVSGNLMSVSAFDIEGDLFFAVDQEVGKLVLTIHGAVEHSAFFDMFKLIEEAHKVQSALRRKHGS